MHSAMTRVNLQRSASTLSLHFRHRKLIVAKTVRLMRGSSDAEEGGERQETNGEKETVKKCYGHSGLNRGPGEVLKDVSEHAQPTILAHDGA